MMHDGPSIYGDESFMAKLRGATMNTQIASRKTFAILRIAAWSLGAAILIVPAIAMQFSSEVNWGPGDFLVMGSLVLLVGGAIEGISRMAEGGRLMKYALAGGVLLLGLAIWVELAVGIFD